MKNSEANKSISNRRGRRAAHGMSMVEMLSAMFIMAFVGAAITELCASQNLIAFRTTSRVDGVIKARRAMVTLDKDIRAGNVFLQSYTPATFAPADNSVATWPSPPYFADTHTLIIQRPDFGVSDDALYPAATPKVVVYKVLADKRNPGLARFVLQRAVFSTTTSDPQTILTGIVGPVNPLDPSDSIAQTPVPKVFGPIHRMMPLYSSKGTTNFSPSSLVRGIACNFEIYESSSAQSATIPKTIGFRKEVYARGNYAINP